jgi:hypothetical protein
MFYLLSISNVIYHYGLPDRGTRHYARATMGLWQGVAMDLLKFHPGPPYPTLLFPRGRPPLKRPYGRFRGSLPTGRAAWGRLLPPRTPYAVRPCLGLPRSSKELPPDRRCPMDGRDGLPWS